MARSSSKQRSKKSTFQKLRSQLSKLGNVNFLKSLLFDVKYLFPVSAFLLVVETCLSVFVVNKVSYTEIDWKAYMQEVEGVINGTFDYSLLKGDTGPLVYPAGFVYVYSLLYFITDLGRNIKCAQYLFVVLYITLLFLVFRLYWKSKKVPPYMLLFMCLTSYRIHSIFMLRLFNDSIAVVFMYAALNLYIDEYWSIGSVFYSLAVSVKMNILLYAPALLLTFLTSLGLKKTIGQLSICALVQLLLGLPFLLTNPYSYLWGAFDLSRVFLHKWTVNWRFLPEEIFIDRTFHLGLLAVHLFLLGMFYNIGVTFLNNYARLKVIEQQVKPQLKQNTEFVDMRTSCQLLLLPLFLSNFIGVACSRSLHYQFYVWYYHSIPYLLWCSQLPVVWRLTLLGIIELCWNTYPSTELSSAMLHLSHITLMYSIFVRNWRLTKQQLTPKEKD